MSHFTTIKTAFTDAGSLEKALADVAARFGLSSVRRNTTVSGWQGITTTAELVVSTRNAGYDLGFKQEAGHYTLVGDWYGIKDIKQDARPSPSATPTTPLSRNWSRNRASPSWRRSSRRPVLSTSSSAVPSESLHPLPIFQLCKFRKSKSPSSPTAA
ncbi:MAG: DUF1257 domain-containing protein [Verrucomicrobia bacterium]|nr:DUF1257 domain-containing protein [Verrucomicrobiota bacterium]